MDAAALRRWLRGLAAAAHEQAAALNALDAAIGDGDHGTNLDRGFAAVSAGLDETTTDLGALCTAAGRALISTVGGASGVLYGTLFLRLGSSLAGKQSATTGELAAAFRSGAEGVAARGRSALGEKTMLDALLPAVDALEAAAATGETPTAAAELAARAAEEGARATISLMATKGRAANLGPRGVGHQDPGAAACAILVQTLAAALVGASG